MFVEDHCSAILKVLDNGTLGEVYNIGGLNEKTNIEVVTHICKILDDLKPRLDGKSYKDQITYIKDRPGHDRRYAIDATKISNDLAWSPELSFEDGIKQTVNWYLNNQSWVAEIISRDHKMG